MNIKIDVIEYIIEEKRLQLLTASTQDNNRLVQEIDLGFYFLDQERRRDAS